MNTVFVGRALRVRPMAPDERQGRLAFVDSVLAGSACLSNLTTLVLPK
jgi:hypothetical protein